MPASGRRSSPQFGLLVDDTVAAGGEPAGRLARAAERAGFESLWSGERVKWRDEPPESWVPAPNPLIVLAYWAGMTRRLTVATGVLRLPRDPATLAREMATLARLAPGRVVLGIGVGGVYEEVRRPGLRPDERARRTDAYVRDVRSAWERDQDRSAFSGTGEARGSVPVIVGGRSEPAARRAGRLGDGFFPLATSWEVVERLVGVMRQAAATAGRDPAAVAVTCLGSARFDEMDRSRWRELGVSRVVFPLPGRGGAGWEAGLAELAERTRRMIRVAPTDAARPAEMSRGSVSRRRVRRSRNVESLQEPGGRGA